MGEISKKSRLAAGLLCWFLGAFGAHRMYVGKVGSGAVMLAVSLTVVGLFATGLWALVDLILILCGSFTDRDGLEIKAW